jgi:ATP-dependent Clp protease adaptor protein ClpS
MSDYEDVVLDSGATATATRPQRAAKSDEDQQTRRMPPYHVVILNDEEHTFDYVIELLAKLFGHGRSVAEGLAWKIHHQGRGVVYTTHKERAELKREQVIAYGPDPRLTSSTSSLGCYIEPAPVE